MKISLIISILIAFFSPMNFIVGISPSLRFAWFPSALSDPYPYRYPI